MKDVDGTSYRENPYNKHLPYATAIEEEARQSLAEIKFNLGRAVIFKELTPGCLVWCNRLDTYMRLYGRKFSKEDHVLFVKLLYELLLTPDLEPQFVRGLAVVLERLLKKKELLTPEDLVLPWHPLYKLVESIHFSKLEPYGLKRFPQKFSEQIIQVVKVARYYFSEESTEEMLLEFRPLLCPFDSVKDTGAYYLSRFLPTKLPERSHTKGFRMWFDELMEYWLKCAHRPGVVYEDLALLFTRLAEDNLGHIDWNPYMPEIFNHFLSGLNLPVATDGSFMYAQTFDFVSANTAARWFVYMIGGESKALDHLQQLFTSLESFYHPSNYGKFSDILLRFLDHLCNQFVKRLHDERHKKENWLTKSPDHVRITDDEIHRFVCIVKDVALLSVFSKSGAYQAASIIQSLALLRPELVLPTLIDRTLEALETLVEPHQVTATLACVSSVSRVLVRASKYYPAGPTHVVPLLQQILPGIDSNDFQKSLASFTVISAVVSLIPLVDCSVALECGLEMTDVEKELCVASGQFEDFVLQFIDRCFILIENCTAESTTDQDGLGIEGANMVEDMLSMGLNSAVTTVMMQSSPQIFESILDCLFIFCSTRVLEVNVAGKMVSDMCRTAVKAYPAVALKKFLPHFCTTILNLASVEGVAAEEHVDSELLWYLELLSELVRCDGVHLLPYKVELIAVIRLCLHLKCKKAYSRAGKLLKAVLCMCTETYVKEWRSLDIGFEKPPAEHLYIRDWGRPGNLDSLKIDWHVPSREELDFVAELIREFMIPELKAIESWIDGHYISRDELHQRLQILAVMIFGASTVLETWDEPILPNLCSRTLVGRTRAFNIVQMSDVLTFRCGISRKEVVLIIHKFMDHLLRKNEDDTKTLRIVAKIYDFLLLHHGVNYYEFTMRWKSAHAVKKALSDRLHGNKMHVRAIMVERVQLQHDMRVLDRHGSPFGATDKLVIDDLVKLSTSSYTEVRMDAQKVLFSCIELYDYAARSVLPDLLSKMQNSPDVTHEALKGALYVLQYSRVLYLITHYWETALQTWPVIVCADHSEKPSIVKLINRVVSKMMQKYDSLAIERMVSDQSVTLARQLLQTSDPKPSTNKNDHSVDISTPMPTPADENLALEVLVKANQESSSLYAQLIDRLCAFMEDSNIHWRHAEICVKFLVLLLRHDVPYPVRAIRVMMQLLIHDAVAMRQIATRAVAAIMYKYRRCWEKVPVDYAKHQIDSSPQSLLSLPVGDSRTDNQWLQFRPHSRPLSQSDIDKFAYVDKTHFGYYTWPVELLTYAPSADQPKLSRPVDSMPVGEQVVYECFVDDAFVEKLVKFMALEEKKGKDAFRTVHFNFFKGFFRNFDVAFLEKFMPLLCNLIGEDLESSHRCAAEIISGMIRGSKHWHYDMLKTMWDFLCPLLRKVFANIMPEMLKDWGMALLTATESRDPNRYHDLFSMMLDNPLSGDGGAFSDSGRLYILMSTAIQQEWRASAIYSSILDYLKPFMAHPYQSVRARIGGLLSYIVIFDLNFSKATATLSPTNKCVADLFAEDLRILSEETLAEASLLASIATTEKMEIDGLPTALESARISPGDAVLERSSDRFSAPAGANSRIAYLRNDSEVDREERARRERLAKTALSFLFNMSYAMQPINNETYRLVELLMPLEAREDDPELIDLCKKTFQRLSAKQIPGDLVDTAVEMIRKVSNYKSWNARRCALTFLQSMVFHNSFTLNSEKNVAVIKDIVVERLLDDQLEVRDVAAKLLSGLVHFGYIRFGGQLQSCFLEMANAKVKKPRRNGVLSQKDQLDNSVALHRRHGGILGLSACILAYPYDVLDWMPSVLLEIAEHLHDNEQIEATVKKTMSDFRRTHYDNWQVHKLKFTEEQLAVLADLLISPSYYA